MPWKRLEDIFEGSLEDILKTSRRHLEDVFKTSWRRLEDLWPRQIYWSWPRRLEDVFWRRKAKANIFILIKTSWKRLLKMKTKDVFKTSSSRRMFAGELLQTAPLTILNFLLTIKISYFSFSRTWKFRDLTWHERRIHPTLTSFSVLAFLPLLQLLECLNG